MLPTRIWEMCNEDLAEASKIGGCNFGTTADYDDIELVGIMRELCHCNLLNGYLTSYKELCDHLGLTPFQHD
jgi:hypothetical protein